jgi:DNA-binding FrmR family transcriptional regulator
MEAKRKADICRRLRCIEGHTRGVGRMIEAQAECSEIIHQLGAIQGSLKRVRRILIEEYLAAELSGALDGEEPEEYSQALGQVAELLNLVE